MYTCVCVHVHGTCTCMRAYMHPLNDMLTHSRIYSNNNQMIARAYKVYKPLVIAKLLALSPAPAPVQFSVGEYLYL